MNYTLVGAFVLLLGAALVAGVLWLAAGGAWQNKNDLYLCLVDESVAGLSVNAPVKYNGVDVGQVRSIRLDSGNPERVRLVFAIERGTPIHVDTVAVLKIQGLTGIAYVELAGGGQHSAPLVADTPGTMPVIQSKASLSARLENVITAVLAKVDRTSGTVDALLSEENRAAVASALADVATITRTVAARAKTLDAGLSNAARTAEQGALLATQLRAQLGPLLVRFGRSADAVELAGAEAATASTQAGLTVQAVGAEVQRLAADTTPELQRLMAELQALSVSLRRFSDSTERNPASLLFGRSPVPDGPGEGAASTAPPPSETRPR